MIDSGRATSTEDRNCPGLSPAATGLPNISRSSPLRAINSAKPAIDTAATEHFIASEAEGCGRGLVLLLKRVTPYGAIRLGATPLLHFSAVQQTTATRVSGGKPARSAGADQARAPEAVRQPLLFMLNVKLLDAIHNEISGIVTAIFHI
ncbi:hypothetical protein [Nonomuraea endophytica]|uniref:hypothetical protein n=1 Tax=Nonomuraea endophytica TaxID=714136 RepID=UPI0037C62ACA